MIDLVIAAHNEADQLGAVLEAVGVAPSIGAVIVVCDACSDATAKIAQQGASTVLVGDWANKGSAMAVGLQLVTTSDVMFVDADLEGLSTADVELLATAPPSGGQVVGLPETDTNPGFLPSVSGQRRLPAAIARTAGLYGSGWRAETLLNIAVARAGLPWRHYRLPGVTNPFTFHPETWWKVPLVQLENGPELVRYMLAPDGRQGPSL